MPTVKGLEFCVLLFFRKVKLNKKFMNRGIYIMKGSGKGQAR